MTDARRAGPIIIMLVGVALMVSAFVTTTHRPDVTVGGPLPTSTTLCRPGAIGVVEVCPTTTTQARTTTTRTAVIIGPLAQTTTTRGRTTSTSDNDPTVTSRQDDLPRTGAPSIPLLLAGLALLSLGALLLLASRPRGARLRR